MTRFQRIIKYLAIALAICLILSILGGILGIVGAFGIFGNADAVGEMTQYPVEGEITALKLEIHAAELTVEESDHFYVESNLKALTVKEDHGTLVIRQKDTFLKNYNGAVLKLGIPKDHNFTEAHLETGAGKVEIVSLSAQMLTMELGAGEVQINSLNAAESAKIQGGAGKITVSNGSLKNLDLEMGVGELNLTAALLGSSELQLGVGETSLILLPASGDYTVCVEKGVGSATVNGQEMKNDSVYGGGTNRVELEGGVGSIRVTVPETEALDGI